MITLLAAVGNSGQIGLDGGLPWNVPADLKHFRATTLGGTVVMGRLTYESLPRPLTGRRVVVLTSREIEGVETATSAEDVLAMTDQDMAVFVCGGHRVFEAFLPHADRMLLSRMPYDGTADTFFPEFDVDEWEPVRDTPMDGFRLREACRSLTTVRPWRP